MPSAKSLKEKSPESKTKATMEEVMHEFKNHELKSGPGGKAGAVKSRKQAIAIGLSEARKAGGAVKANPADSGRKSSGKRARGASA